MLEKDLDGVGRMRGLVCGDMWRRDRVRRLGSWWGGILGRCMGMRSG